MLEGLFCNLFDFSNFYGVFQWVPLYVKCYCNVVMHAFELNYECFRRLVD